MSTKRDDNDAPRIDTKRHGEKGKVTQKHMAFRADYDVLKLLQKVGNKGRFLNNLVRQYFREHAADWDCADQPAELEDNQP